MKVIKIKNRFDNDYVFPVKIASVAIDGVAYYFDKLYDYIVPIEITNEVFIGQRVVIPFGKSNNKRIGLILNIKKYTEKEQLPYFTQTGLAIKPIFKIIDVKAVINEEMVKVICWLKQHTFCRYFDAVKTVIPSGYNITLLTKYRLANKIDSLIYSDLSDDEISMIEIFRNTYHNNEISILMIENLTNNQREALQSLIKKKLVLERDIFKRKIKDQKSVMVKLKHNLINEDDVNNNYKITQKQKKVIDLLLNSETASLKEILYMYDVSKSVLDNLNKKEIIEYFDIETYRQPYALKFDNFEKKLDLNIEQKSILDKLILLINNGKCNISLLRGVTGSGKTLICISLIKYIISKGKTAIFLIPEIALTSQMIVWLKQYFGDLVAVLHSGLTLANRLDEWKRVKNKEAKIVLGTRSAIFAPVENIGLIIMDEEQESSYKSESSPRYHVRDIAKIRAFYNNALFLMVSATPSVETYYWMKKNKFHIFELDKRYNDNKLPLTLVVDMKKERLSGNNSYFSNQLIASIESRLIKKQQAIIFINRRGYNTIIKCDECGYVETCPNCDIALTYHKINNKLICHYCGYYKNIIKNCTRCGSFYIQYIGAGTQKIEIQLQSIFPSAKILRLDTDNIVTRFSYDEYFNDFLNGKYDILIGTQMVAKGLNFPNVTLVGVIDADQSLYNSDYRAVEKTYDLIIQVIGRSGRGSVEGMSIIQTNFVDNDIFEIIANKRYIDFFNQEIKMRKNLLYPPFCDMLAIGIVGNREDMVIETGNDIFYLIKSLVANEYNDIKIKMFGPVPEVVSKVNNKYRYKIFVKYSDSRRFRNMMDFMLIDIAKKKQKYGVNIFIDKI